MMFDDWLERAKKRFGTPLEKNNPVSAELSNAAAEFRESMRAIRGSQTVAETEFVAIDFETTGLGNKDHIISMGFCPIHQQSIRLAQCQHLIVNATQLPSTSSILIHRLTHDQIATGISQQQALIAFFNACKGKVLIVHFHKMERQYLQNLARQILGDTLPLKMIDTFQIAKANMQRRHQIITSRSLRLYQLRRSYHLPDYHAHNALEDAIATAELFLAQVAATRMPLDTLSLKHLSLFSFNR